MNRRFFKQISCTAYAAAVIVMATAAHAESADSSQQASSRTVHFVGGLGVSFGGDKLASGTYSNGDSWTIRAGSGIALQAGIEVDVAPSWSVRTTVGWHEHSTNAKNGEVKFQRHPLDLVGLYSVNAQWRVGAGVHRSLSPKLSCSGVVGNCSVSFSGSTGPVFVGQYQFGQPQDVWRMGLEASYTMENFRANNGAKAKGDHLSLALVLRY
ncbi:MAG: hypothetical protein E6Q94_10635 [Burkholderiaceae bacterium]|nr:MAG: hypothetical protein E6Q94_10635 [Burkholderiaceae bacterium]